MDLQKKVQSIVFRREVFLTSHSFHLTPEGVTLNRNHFLTFIRFVNLRAFHPGDDWRIVAATSFLSFIFTPG